MGGYGYSIALFVHLVALLAACSASALAGYAGLRMRHATSPADVARSGMMIGKVVRVFPFATLGLLASGVYMTQEAWSWSTPWVWAGAVGLGMIVVLGSGLEASRGRALKNEVRAHGLSERARGLLRDPIAWTAKAMTWTLMVGITFMMTTKPPAWGCVVTLAAALLAGAIIAVPLRRAPAPGLEASAPPAQVVRAETG